MFRLRGYTEHVGDMTIALREPSRLVRALVLPHGAWAHRLHHELPGLPSHRYADVLHARGTQGLTVSAVFALFETSPALVSGELIAADDPRSLMQRGAAQGRLGVSVVR